MKEYWCPYHSKVTERWEIVLQLFYKRFNTFLNEDTPKLQATRVNQLYNEAHPFMYLVYTVISLQTMQNDVFSPKFRLPDFLRYP